MPKVINKLFSTIQIIFFLVASSYGDAQQIDDNEVNWYQVEIVIFANETWGSAQGEQWPSDLRLRYPANSVQLNHSKVTPVDYNDEPPVAALTTQGDSSSEINAITDPAINTLPIAFELLPASQHSLTTQMKALTTQSDFRPLFHGAWLQPMADRDNSIAVVIRGGEQFDDHFELEGTVKLSVERYLHIQTDLWLSRFINAVASDEPNWNILPKVPAQEAFNKKTTVNFFLDIDQPLHFLKQQDRFGVIEQRQFRVEETVVMRQDRRMRSHELHYIDHPLFGVLVKVVPFNSVLVSPSEAGGATKQ